MWFDMNDPNLIKKLSDKHKLDKEIKNIIQENLQPWLYSVEEGNFSEIEKNQKIKEIIDMGNFLYYFDQEFKIINALGESPDIVVSKNEITVGVELKDIVIRDDEKEVEGILKSLFQQIESELKLDEKRYKGIYRVEFINENLTLKAKDRNQIKVEIIALIKGHDINLKYLKKIIKTSGSGISLYKGETTIVGELKRSVVVEKIKSKNIKFENYRSDKFQEIWLLLVLGGEGKSSDYSFMEETITTVPFETKFNRIFIYDFFNHGITELLTQNVLL